MSYNLSVKDVHAEYGIKPNSLYKHKLKIRTAKRPGIPILFPRKNLERWLKDGILKSVSAEHLPVLQQKLDISLQDYIMINLKGGNSTLAKKEGAGTLEKRRL